MPIHGKIKGCINDRVVIGEESVWGVSYQSAQAIGRYVAYLYQACCHTGFIPVMLTCYYPTMTYLIQVFYMPDFVRPTAVGVRNTIFF